VPSAVQVSTIYLDTDSKHILLLWCKCHCLPRLPIITVEARDFQRKDFEKSLLKCLFILIRQFTYTTLELRLSSSNIKSSSNTPLSMIIWLRRPGFSKVLFTRSIHPLFTLSTTYAVYVEYKLRWLSTSLLSHLIKL